MSFLNLRNFWLGIKRDKQSFSANKQSFSANKQSFSANKILLGIILLGFLLRAINPVFGSPSLYLLNDEAIEHLSALNMLGAKTPISIANYTPLGVYLQIPFILASFLTLKIFGTVSGVRAFELFLLTHEGYFLFIPRIISVFFGTLAILVIYKITKNLFKEKSAALSAAFFTAVSFNLVHISHFGRPWSAALFFLALSTYFALKDQTVSSFIWSAVGFGFHQVGIFVLPLILLLQRIRLKAIIGLLLAGLLMVILGSLTLKTGIIESINNDQSFLKDKTLITEVLSGRLDLWRSITLTLQNNLSLYFIKNVFVTDGIILIFGILGVVKCISGTKQQKVLVLYILGYFLFASLFFWPLMRYVLPAFLLLVPLAGIGVGVLKNQKWLLMAILIIASINSFWWNFLYLKTPTFIQVSKWIKGNVPVNVPIAYIGARYQTFVPSKEAISYVEKTDPGFHKTLYGVFDNNKYDNVRNILYLSKFPGRTKLDQFKNATAGYRVKYIIDYYLVPSERIYLENPEMFRIVAQFSPTPNNSIEKVPEPLFDASSNFPTYDERGFISMYSILRIGPNFDVLEVKGY